MGVSVPRSRNVGTKISFCAALGLGRARISCTSRQKPEITLGRVSSPFRHSIPGSSGPWPDHYTNWAILAPDINRKMYPNGRFSFNRCVFPALSMEEVGSLQTLPPVYQTTRHHKPQDWAHHLTCRSLPFHFKPCLIQSILWSASLWFRDQFLLPYSKVAIHDCFHFTVEVLRIVHSFQFTTCGHPCYNPPYLWTVSDATVFFSSPLVVTPVTILRTCESSQPGSVFTFIYFLLEWGAVLLKRSQKLRALKCGGGRWAQSDGETYLLLCLSIRAELAQRCHYFGKALHRLSWTSVCLWNVINLKKKKDLHYT